MEKIMQNRKVIKIICIAFAVLLWFYVSYQENPTMTKTVRNVPLTIVGQHELKENGYSVLSVSVEDVDVKATAKRLSLARINNRTLTATIDVSSITSSGQHVIPASVTSSLSSGGSYYTKGKDITVVIEPILTKTKKIEKIISSPSSSSVKLKSSELSEDNVIISAPESIMKKVSSVRTETIIPGTTGGSQTVNLIVYSNDGKVLDDVECEPSKVTVYYSLYNVKWVPIVLKTAEGKYFDLPSEYIIEVCSSSEKEFNNLKHIETEPVDLSHYEVGSTVSVKLDIPDFIEKEKDETYTIKFTLDEEYIESQKQTDVE